MTTTITAAFEKLNKEINDIFSQTEQNIKDANKRLGELTEAMAERGTRKLEAIAKRHHQSKDPAERAELALQVDSNNRYYTITYADDPVGVGHHNELYIKFGGVLNG